jgi:hypothetical protein
MRQKTERQQGAADRTIKDIRRQTRKRYSSEEKIWIVLSVRGVLFPQRMGAQSRPVLGGRQSATEPNGQSLKSVRPDLRGELSVISAH